MLIGSLYTTSCTVIIRKLQFILPISLYVPVISGVINGKRKQYSFGNIATFSNNKQHFLILIKAIPGSNCSVKYLSKNISLNISSWIKKQSRENRFICTMDKREFDFIIGNESCFLFIPICCRYVIKGEVHAFRCVCIKLWMYTRTLRDCTQAILMPLACSPNSCAHQ